MGTRHVDDGATGSPHAVEALAVTRGKGSARSIESTRERFSLLTPASVPALQRTVGNRAVTEAFSRPRPLGALAVQRYTKMKWPGNAGTFIGIKEVHLHLGISSGNHLKIRSERYNLRVGTEPDLSRMEKALEALLEFRESIANDRPSARKCAQAIQDCIDWFRDKGVTARAPVPTKPSDVGGTEKEEKPGDTGGGYGDFFSPDRMSSNKDGHDDEDDFM